MVGCYRRWRKIVAVADVRPLHTRLLSPHILMALTCLNVERTVSYVLPPEIDGCLLRWLGKTPSFVVFVQCNASGNIFAITLWRGR